MAPAAKRQRLWISMVPLETQATLQFRRAVARLTLTFAGEVQAEEAEGRR
jgi:hypothetical protein